MEPIPETLEAINELEPYDLGGGSLLDELKRAAAQARAVAPGLAGVSLASVTDGVTFTLVATADEIAALDGVQYLTNGPCVEVADDGQGMATTSDDLLGERRWHALGQASAAAGVSSTLTFPIMTAGKSPAPWTSTAAPITPSTASTRHSPRCSGHGRQVL